MIQSLKLIPFYALLALIALPAKALDRFSAATYSELNKPLFVAELWQEAGVAAEALLQADIPFEIHLTVLSKSIGRRQFRRIWLEGVAINHDAETLKKLNRPLAQFNKVIKGRLQYGDNFRVRYTPRGSTVITLNDVTLMSSRNDGFASVLLGSWLGAVPLSAQFKQQLIDGRNDPQILDLKAHLGYSKQRQREIRRWIEPARVVSVSKAPTVVAAVATNHQAESHKDQVSLDSQRLTPTQLAHLPPAHSGINTSSAPEFKESELTFAIRQHYYTRLSRHLKQYQTTPYAAFQKRWQGEVKLWVEINRRGEVIEKNILRRDRRSLFNDDALATLDRAQPFPPIPEALPDNSIGFSVPLIYSLPR